MSKIEIE